MALVASTSMPNGALTTPVPITPTASDTIAASSFGANGCLMRIITTGTATNVSIMDPNLTTMGNAGTSASLTAPATGARMLPIPVSSINQATGVATVTFSGALTGVTYELYRY
jgi:hypothetical protein